MATRATDKPVVRIVTSKYDGELVAEIRADGVTLRKKGSRRGGQRETVVRWGWIYNKGIENQNA